MPDLDKKNILVTARARVGKSTLIKRVTGRLKELGYKGIGGFYTLEVSEGGSRTGFDIHTLDGRVAPLARAGLKSPFTLGRYGIDRDRFEAVAVPALEDAIKKGYMVVIDEIGFMELKSHRFRELVAKALSAPAPLLATIMRSRYDFVEAIKGRSDVELIRATVQNRDVLVEEIVKKVRRFL